MPRHYRRTIIGEYSQVRLLQTHANSIRERVAVLNCLFSNFSDLTEYWPDPSLEPKEEEDEESLEYDLEHSDNTNV